MAYQFSIAPLPKSVYELLRKVAAGESVTQRTVIVAAILALYRLKDLKPDHAADVLTEAKKLCPRRAATTTGA